MSKSDARLAVVLSLAATACCLGAAGVMLTQTMTVGGRRPTAGEALAMVALPAIASLGASWAAWRGRRGVVITMAAVVGLYSLVTGFSFGAAFYPALGLLIWAVIAGIDG